jgi:hypothetical protein
MKKLNLPQPQLDSNTPSTLAYHDANEEIIERLSKKEDFALFIHQFTDNNMFILRGHANRVNSKENPVILFMRNNITCCFLNPNQLAIVHTEVKRYENTSKIKFEYNVLSYGCECEAKTRMY